jgi:hypothetical protein
MQYYLLSFYDFTTFFHEGNLIDVVMYKQQSHIALPRDRRNVRVWRYRQANRSVAAAGSCSYCTVSLCVSFLSTLQRGIS